MTMLNEGTYRARALKADLGKSSTGNAQVGIEFEILADGYAGEKITAYRSFTQTQLKNGKTVQEMTIEELIACGWNGDDWDNFTGLGTTEVDLVVQHDTYQGKTKAKVAFINTPGSGVALKAPMVADDRKAFAAQMKGTVAMVRSRMATNATRAADDVPF